MVHSHGASRVNQPQNAANIAVAICREAILTQEKSIEKGRSYTIRQWLSSFP